MEQKSATAQYAIMPIAFFNDKSLSAPEKLMLAVLFSYANKNSECWPSLTAIAKRASLSRRNVAYQLKSLEQKGIVVRTRRTEPGKSEPSSTLYRIVDSASGALGSAADALQVVQGMHQGSARDAPEHSHRTIPIEQHRSSSAKKETELSPTLLQIETVLRGECEKRNVSWDYGKERKCLLLLSKLKGDDAELERLADRFVKLTQAPSGFLSGKPPTASTLKAFLSTVEASIPRQLPTSVLPPQRANQDFDCPKCGTRILKGDIGCPVCGASISEMGAAK